MPEPPLRSQRQAPAAQSMQPMQSLQQMPPAPGDVRMLGHSAAMAQGAGMEDIDEEEYDDYDLDEEPVSPGSVPRGHVPVPEPEDQPAQRPSGDQRQQRPIRRLDPKVHGLPRGGRNTPIGDVIDIPAFLRKR